MSYHGRDYDRAKAPADCGGLISLILTSTLLNGLLEKINSFGDH